MADRYRLPDALGGLLCERVPVGAFPLPADMIWVNVFSEHRTAAYRFAAFESSLIPAKASLPDEPPDGAVVQAGIKVFQRTGTPFDGDYEDEAPWYQNGVELGVDWEYVCSCAHEDDGGVPVRLVPDPFAESVELPATIYAGLTEIRVMPATSDNDVRMAFNRAWALLPRGDARMLARALWSAAGAAESSETS